MKKIEITIGGVSYPAAPTMGAMLRFKRETGKEITEIGAGDISAMAVYMWCCVVSACNREKRSFDYSLDDFADNITPEVVAAWSAAMEAASAPETRGRKKKV